MSFFYEKENTNYFRESTYIKILPYLNISAVPFWNLVMTSKNRINFIENTTIIPRLVKENFNNISNISKIYKEENFYILKENLKKTNYQLIRC